MFLPPSRQGCARLGILCALPQPSSPGVSASGDVVNSSSRHVWITAGNQKHCLIPGESSDSAGIDDADGLLLDGRSVLFDSLRTDLGGGQVYRQGAIKICDLGTLTVRDCVLGWLRLPRRPGRVQSDRVVRAAQRLGR